MGTRSIADIKEIAIHWRNANTLPAYVRDLALIVLNMARDIEHTSTRYPGTLKTLDDMVECLLEEVAPYTTHDSGSE